MDFVDAIRAAVPMPDEPADKEHAADGTRDGELDAMIKEAPLLDLIRKDTGEQGHESGGRIDFHTCPVCGHHDDFSYYHGQNTWACLSASNTTGITGGSFLDYAIATGRATDTAGAVRMLREVTGHALDHAKRSRATNNAGGWTAPIKTVPAITTRDNLPELPPEVIEGIVRQGGKLLVAGASKSGKSYLLIELAVAVATAGSWVGFKCIQGRVLYVNLEIQEPQFMHRVFRVTETLGAQPRTVSENLDIANLRGRYSNIEDLVIDMLASFGPNDYDLVIIDPAYKAQSGHENDADAITAFCAQLDRLAEGLRCTIAYTHHHSKGAQGGKNAADRASGSGVFARDADALIDMTELEHDENVQESKELLRWHGARPFRLEFVLRDFKEPKPLDIWFRYPIHEKDVSGMLADSNYRRPGGNSFHDGQNKKALTKYETKLDEFMGDRDVIDRKEFLEHISTGGRPVDARTVNKYVRQSTLFDLVSDSNSATIHRVKNEG